MILQPSAEILNPFSQPRQTLGDLDADIAATVIAMAADIALIVDGAGVIRDLAFGHEGLTSEQIARADFANWVGTALIDTVTVESRAKIEQLFAEVSENGATRWRQVNHPTSGGIDLPMRYALVRMDEHGRLLVLGRELSTMAALQQRLVEAQLSMEREYARLRHAETRYRLLFHVTEEPVAIVNAGSRKIVEVNPAAAQLFGSDPKRLSGRTITDVVAPESVDDLVAVFAAVRSSGRADEIRVALADGTGVLVSTALFRQGGEAHYLVRFTPPDPAAQGAPDADRDSLFTAIQSLPEGFVVTDRDQRIVSANPAFLDLAELATEEQAVEQPIDRWLGRAGVDVNVLIANLRDHGALRQFSTILNGEYGSEEEVEVAAVAIETEGGQRYAFSIRSVGRRMVATDLTERTLPGSVSQLTELVGRVPLKELVRDTTDVIERLCIETALKLTGDNRASAAEMLGLSRQSLYSKLRRYGLGDLDGDSE